jgi:hypothetical protein
LFVGGGEGEGLLGATAAADEDAGGLVLIHLAVDVAEELRRQLPV